MKLDGVLAEFKNEIRKLYGNRLETIVLYGSWARGDATDGSDIDILVVLEGKIFPGREIDRMIDIITEMNMKHGVLVSVYPISKNDYFTTNSPLLLNVRKEGIST